MNYYDIRIGLCICLAILFSIDSEPARGQDVRSLDFRDCSAQQKTDLRAANRVLRQLQGELGRDFEWEARLPRGERRTKRRIRRLVDDMKINCDRPRACDGMFSRGKGHAIGARFNICYNNIQTITQGDFCSLVETMAHEFAHWVGMNVGANHNRGASRSTGTRDGNTWSGTFDAPYKFGAFAYDHCHNRGLGAVTFPLSPGTVVNLGACDRTLDPGLLGFPGKNFRGCPRQFEKGKEYPDIRVLGWNRMISSVQVKESAWEACRAPNFGGWCTFLRTSSRNLGDVHMEDRIMSLRPYKKFNPTDIIVRRRDSFNSGEHQAFGAAESDLGGSGINNDISSIYVPPGSAWQFCKRPDFQGGCLTLTGGSHRLVGTGFDNQITSFRQVDLPKGIIVYKNRNGMGATLTVTGTISDLRGTGMKNEISGIRVLSGSWEFCTRTNRRGQCLPMKAGDVNLDLKGSGFNNDIESIIQLVEE